MSKLVSRGGGGGGSGIISLVGVAVGGLCGGIGGGGVGGGGVLRCRLFSAVGDAGGERNFGRLLWRLVGVATLDEDADDDPVDLDGVWPLGGVSGGGVVGDDCRCGFFGGRSGGSDCSLGGGGSAGESISLASPSGCGLYSLALSFR